MSKTINMPFITCLYLLLLILIFQCIDIAEEDWEAICNHLPQFIPDYIRVHPEHAKNFPENPKFYFAAIRLGQSARRPDYLSDFDSVHFAFLKLTGNYILSIHCAFDFRMRDAILWWKPEFITKCWAIRFKNAPKKLFWVGLVPGLGNITYDLIPATQCIVHAQYYTKLFSSFHRDTKGIFQRPMIAKRFYKIFCCKLNGDTLTKDASLDKLLTGEAMFKFADFLLESLAGSIPARLEIVCSTSFQQNQQHIVPQFSEIISDAFSHSKGFIFANKLVSNSMIHAMPTAEFKNRTSTWIGAFKVFIRQIRGKKANTTY